MGVYRRTDADILDVNRDRWEAVAAGYGGAGPQEWRKKSSPPGKCSWRGTMAGPPRPHPAAHGPGPLDGVSGEGHAAEIARLATAGPHGLGAIQEALGNLSLDQLRTKTIEDYLTERLQDVTLATVSKELGILKSAYTRALRWDWVATTPFRGITLNQEGEERLRWLTDAEEARLVDAAAPWLRDFILVGLDTGLRRSNLVGLQWGWLHEQGTVLIVPRQLVKAKKATVMIPLTTRAARIIRRQVRHGDAPYVFTQPDGAPTPWIK